MTNRDVIEIITRLMDPLTDKMVYNITEVFTAIAHGYSFIHPGKDTTKFFRRIEGILESARKDMKKRKNKAKNETAYEEWLYDKIVSEAVLVMRMLFNERVFNYFKELTKDSVDVAFTGERLEDYLYFLDTKELRSLLGGIIAFKENNNFFISDENYRLMMEEFEYRSIYVAQQEADSEADFMEHVEYIKTTPMPGFDYLCRETIIDIIYRYIDIDPVLLAHMIKVYLCTESTNMAADYMGLAAKAMYVFGVDVFDPLVTDEDEIQLEDNDINHSNVPYSNEADKLMVVKSR